VSMANRVSFRHERIGGLLGEEPDHLYRHNLCNGGAITVLDRMTGFGHRDVETGYRSPCGAFWLASGHEDIRRHLAEFNSEDEMAQWVMGRANNCTGGRSDWYGPTLAQLLARENWRPMPLPKPPEVKP
jgi:hypothetical protein